MEDIIVVKQGGWMGGRRRGKHAGNLHLESLPGYEADQWHGEILVRHREEDRAVTTPGLRVLIGEGIP